MKREHYLVLTMHWIKVTKVSFGLAQRFAALQLPSFTLALLLHETHLVVVRGLIHQDVSPKSVNEESSTEPRSYNRQVSRSLQL